MAINNGHFSKQLVFYPPSQLSLENDLPLWLEEEEEDEVYHTTSYPIYTLDTIIGWGKLDEGDLIDQTLQNQLPITMPLDELVKKLEYNPSTYLCLVDSSPSHIKIVEFDPSKTLKINPSLNPSGREVV